MTDKLLEISTLNNLPKRESQSDSLLDILDVATKEIYITKAYAYFLDRRNKFLFREEFAMIFFKHLLGSEDAAKKWIDCEVRAEQTVQVDDNQFRIDLLFINGNNAIIVENKIFAGRYNKLEAYEEGVQNLGYKNIVKSCFLSFDENDQRSITHQAVCSEMREVLLNEKSAGNEREFYQMLEFIEHLLKLNKIMGNINDFSSYIEYTSVINNAIDLKQRAFDFFDTEIQKVANDLVNTHCTRPPTQFDSSYFEQKKNAWIHVRSRPDSTDIYLTIAYQDFLQFGKEKPIYLIIESTNLDEKGIEQFFEKQAGLLNLKPSENKTSRWRHYFFREIVIMEDEDIKAFIERVKSSAITIFQKIVQFENQKN